VSNFVWFSTYLSVLKMLFMNRFQFSCFVDFFVRIFKTREEGGFLKIRHLWNWCVVFPIRFKLYRADALLGLELVLGHVSRVDDPHLLIADPVPIFSFNAD
jgi:hypothetical protein